MSRVKWTGSFLGKRGLRTFLVMADEAADASAELLTGGGCDGAEPAVSADKSVTSELL